MVSSRVFGSLAALMVAVVIIPVSTAGITPTAAPGGFEFQAAGGGPIGISVDDVERPEPPQMLGGRPGGTFVSGPGGAGTFSVTLGGLGLTDSNIGPFSDNFGQAGGFGDIGGGTGGYPTGGAGGSDPPALHAPAPAAVALGLAGVGILAALRRRFS